MMQLCTFQNKPRDCPKVFGAPWVWTLVFPWLRRVYLLHQWVGDGFGEGSEGAAEGWALPVEDSYREQRHAGALAVESQVEPSPPQWLQTQQLEVGALLTASAQQVVSRHRGHFGVRVLHPGRVGRRGLITVRLVVIKVEGFFAVTLVQTRTLHHGESEGFKGTFYSNTATLWGFILNSIWESNPPTGSRRRGWSPTFGGSSVSSANGRTDCPVCRSHRSARCSTRRLIRSLPPTAETHREGNRVVMD